MKYTLSYWWRPAGEDMWRRTTQTIDAETNIEAVAIASKTVFPQDGEMQSLPVLELAERPTSTAKAKNTNAWKPNLMRYAK